MSDKKVFVYIATNILNWKKWKPTTSPPGKKVAQRWQGIARCFAEIAIGLKAENSTSAQHVVDGLVADKGITVDWHKVE